MPLRAARSQRVRCCLPLATWRYHEDLHSLAGCCHEGMRAISKAERLAAEPPAVHTRGATLDLRRPESRAGHVRRAEVPAGVPDGQAGARLHIPRGCQLSGQCSARAASRSPTLPCKGGFSICKMLMQWLRNHIKWYLPYSPLLRHLLSVHVSLLKPAHLQS